MICLKCGTKANEDDKICANCKTPLQIIAYEFDKSAFDMLNNNQNIAQDNTTDDVKTPDGQTGRKKKVFPKNTVIAIVIGVVIVFSALFVITKIHREERRSEYIESRTFALDEDAFEFIFTEYDGYGKPAAYADIYKVFNALMPALGFKEESIKTKPVMQEIYKNITVTFSENSKLSNGQIITAYINVNEACLEKYDVYFEEMECQVTVEGLKEIKDVDIFENLYIETVQEYGVNSVKWNYLGENELLIESYIKCYPKSGLNYGDKFVLSINANHAEAIKEKLGINPVVLEKEYVLLENNDEYLSDYGSIDDKTIDMLSQKDLDLMKQNPNNLGINLNNSKLVGGFIYQFDEQNITSENCLVLIYKVIAPYSGINSMYVWYAHFDLVQNVQGMQKCLNNHQILGYPTIYYDEESSAYEGIYIDDAIDNVIEYYRMQKEHISYGPELKSYFE